MRRLVRDGIDLAFALGFKLDEDDRALRKDRWLFRHANEPETLVKFDVHMSELAAQAQIQVAKRVAGLAVSDGAERPKPKQNVRAKMERAAQAKRRAAAHAAAEAREAQRQAERLVGQRHKQVAEMERLLRGSPEAAFDATAIPPHAMLTVEQVADACGLTDKAVRRAIDNGALEAYQCGSSVKVKGADARAWLGAA